MKTKKNCVGAVYRITGIFLAVLLLTITFSCENSLSEPPPPDLTIQGMSPADGALISDTSPTLSWSSLSDATSYEIQVAESEAGVESSTPEIVNAPDSEYTIAPALSKGDTRYWRVRARGSDNDYGDWTAILSFEVVYVIGETGPAGGIVFYDKGSYSDGWRYLEAATTNQGSSNVWGGFNTLVGGTSTAIGTGEANTAAIVDKFGAAEPWQNFTNYAAKICYDLEIGIYDDWFLPSKDELAEMYAQRDLIGNFDNRSFWSSSEYDIQSAWYHYFNNNLQNTAEEYHPLWVRACRTF